MKTQKLIFLSLLTLFILLFVSCPQSDDSVSNATFKVNYLLQNVELDDYEFAGEDSFTGEVGTQAKPKTIKTFEGFHISDIQNVLIKEDNSTVVEIKYNRDEIVLSFYDDESLLKTINGYYGLKIPPYIPEKEGNLFVCWSPDLPETFPSSDCSYHAIWEDSAEKVKIYLVAVNGTNERESYTINKGDPIYIPLNYFTVPEGYSFDYWSNDISGNMEVEFPINTNDDSITLYGIFTTSIEYKASVDRDNYTFKHKYIFSEEVNADSYLSIEKFPKDVKFVCWNTKIDGTGDDIYPGEEIILTKLSNQTLYAKYENTTVKFAILTPESDVVKSYKVSNNSYIKFTDRSNWRIPQGYKEISLNTKDDGSGISYSLEDSFYVGNEDIVMYVMLEPKEYSVYYYINHEIYFIDSYTVMDDYSLIKFSDIPGYTFDGWYKDYSYTEKVEDWKAYEKYENLYLYGNNEANIYQLNYFANGGSGTMDTESFMTGESLTVSDCLFTAPKGKKFYAWNTKPDGSGIYYYSKNYINVLNDLNLYAIWKDAKVYFINYLNTEDAINTFTTSFTQNDVLTDLPLTGTCTKEGYEFDGWYSDEYCSEEFKATFIPANTSKDITLYAKWKKINTFEIILNKDDIEFTYSVLGKSVSLKAADGYTDYKWQIGGMEPVFGQNITIDMADYLPSKYPVWLTAYKNGTKYSGQFYIDIK